ncbi:MAG: NAD(P)/FAD-dependent oxidoreductase, partial [Bacillota bacterium]
TGGMSYPATGSTGDGYKMARALGHTIVPPRPALAPIILEDPYIPELEGLSLRNITLSLMRKNKVLFQELGEMVFTDRGISGPLALSASSHMKDDAGEYVIELDLKPGLDREKLDKRILRDFDAYANKQYKNALGDLLPAKLIPVFITLSGIDALRPVHQITRAERMRLTTLFKEWKLKPSALAPMEEAIVTSGGVHVKEVNPATMESKLVRGLYFAGEILDVDALTGGFNLTIAFATGHAAGMHCLST